MSSNGFAKLRGLVKQGLRLNGAKGRYCNTCVKGFRHAIYHNRYTREPVASLIVPCNSCRNGEQIAYWTQQEHLWRVHGVLPLSEITSVWDYSYGR